MLGLITSIFLGVAIGIPSPPRDCQTMPIYKELSTREVTTMAEYAKYVADWQAVTAQRTGRVWHAPPDASWKVSHMTLAELPDAITRLHQVALTLIAQSGCPAP